MLELGFKKEEPNEVDDLCVEPENSPDSVTIESTIFILALSIFFFFS